MAGSDRSYEVELIREDGSSDVLTVGADETILEATDPTDVDLRYGCREGKCVSCTGLLIEGDIEYVTEPSALNDQQRADGFALLCIGKPRSDCRVRVGKSVLGAAFPSLWHVEGAVTQDLIELERASEEIDDVDEATVADDHLESMQGSLSHFDNLKQVREAFDRALETTREKRYH
ncbi:MAG: 2Fe-2S iron-sulfur cluster-binding protein [Haloarculaceae archaeon]